MLEFLSAVYAFAVAHQEAVTTFLLVLIPSLITGLTPYPKAGGAISFLRLALNVLSVLSHHDSPGTFKLPLTVSKTPDSVTGRVVDLDPPQGFVRLPLLAAVAILALAFAAFAAPNPEALKDAVAADPGAVQPAEDPPPPAPQFGGCVKAGKICFGPTVALTVTAINLSTGKIEGAFSPGLGFGMTVNPGKWSSFGTDFYFQVDPAAQQASTAILLKFFNGYLRGGVSKGFIGDRSWRIPLAFGVNL
jgi:hypothetical protein